MYIVTIHYTNDEYANLECNTLEEAEQVRRSFIVYGKDIQDVFISRKN